MTAELVVARHRGPAGTASIRYGALNRPDGDVRAALFQTKSIDDGRELHPRSDFARTNAR